jgi:hypothetical protein
MSMGKSWAWWHTPVIPAMEGILKYENCSPGQLRQKSETLFKINQEKKGAGSWQSDRASA